MGVHIPKPVGERFSSSDLFAFTGGGCHVFAEALTRYLADEHYVLRAVFDARGEKRSLVHVYVQSAGFMVDALGIKREEDFLDHLAESRGVTALVEDVEHSRLFSAVKKSDDAPPCDLNEWGLIVDPWFLEYFRIRAKMLIFIEPRRYQLGYLLSRRKKKEEGKKA